MTVFTFFVFLLIVIQVHAVGYFSVDPVSHSFLDEYGRVRIFHGVNAVAKTFPFLPNTQSFDPQMSLCPQDMADLQEWGFNFIRLGTMWPGYEIAQGQYNLTYLKAVETLVNQLGSYGIYSLLDLHQDLLSPKFCGEGVPDYAVVTDSINPFPLPAVTHTLPVGPNGYPDLSACLKYEFGIFYFAEAVGSAFQSFYENATIQQYMGDFWSAIATRFQNNLNVIGYELLNEPWAGDVYKEPRQLEPGYTDLHFLQPLYDYLNARIRANDQNHLIFYDPATVDTVFPYRTGFTHVPGGPAFDNRSVFSYHVYCLNADRRGQPANWPLCKAFMDMDFTGFIEAFRSIGGGGMMTEWGAMDNSTIDLEVIDWLTGQADNYFQSWSWWQFKSYNDITTQSIGDAESFYDSKGKLQTEKVLALSRTYAYAIAGVPLQMKFNPQSNHFLLQYILNGAGFGGKPTEIYLNEKWRYPNGYSVTITPSSAAKWVKLRRNVIAVIALGKVQQNVTVVIKPS